MTQYVDGNILSAVYSFITTSECLITIRIAHMSLPACYFKGCSRQAVDASCKCFIHKYRSLCKVAGCSSQVFARSLCVKHGGKRGCSIPDCTQKPRVGNLCQNHGGISSRKMCNQANCPKFAQTSGYCSAHGGGKRCEMEKCSTHARKGGLCKRHSAVKQPTNYSKLAIESLLNHNDLL